MYSKITKKKKTKTEKGRNLEAFSTENACFGRNK